MTGDARDSRRMINNASQWGWLSRFFHWATLLLVVLAWWMMELRHDFPKGSGGREMWMAWHMAVGISLWLLTLLRLIWRVVQGAPVVIGRRWQLQMAATVQALLYAILLIMPLLGFAARQLEGKVVSFAGWFDLPVLLPLEKSLGHWAEVLHEDVLWPSLLVLVAVHVAAALWHQFYLRDNLIQRMLFGRAP